MRLLIIAGLFVLSVSMATAHLLALAGAAKGVAALGASVVKLGATIIPAGLLVPLAVLGPVKLTAPALLGLKGLGLLKVKLFLTKTPILAPVGLGVGKFALAKAKFRLAQTALTTAGKAKMGILQLPFKLKVMGIGALAGAKAGFKAGLVTTQHLPKAHLIHPHVIPASIFLKQTKMTDQPYQTFGSKPSSTSYSMPEPEPEEPVYGNKPTSTPAAPAYTPASSTYSRAPPAYTPAPPQSSYRRRREANESSQELALRTIFAYIRENDSNRCVLRIVCELAVEPSLAEGEGYSVTELMMSLDNSDPEAPWAAYRNASLTGRTTHSRKECQERFSQCVESTTALLEAAREHIELVEEE